MHPQMMPESKLETASASVLKSCFPSVAEKPSEIFGSEHAVSQDPEAGNGNALDSALACASDSDATVSDSNSTNASSPTFDWLQSL